MKRNIGTHTYDEVGNGRADGHDHVRAVRGPQRTTRRTELASKDLKGERGFEHERYETEGERHARHYEHEQAWGRAQHAIVATFFVGGGTIRQRIRAQKVRMACLQENVERRSINDDVGS